MLHQGGPARAEEAAGEDLRVVGGRGQEVVQDRVCVHQGAWGKETVKRQGTKVDGQHHRGGVSDGRGGGCRDVRR